MYQIQFKGMDDVFNALSELEEKMTDLSPVLWDISELMLDDVRDNFMTGTAPDGTPWQPKSQATIVKYVRGLDTVSDRPLFGPSGQLRESFFADVGRDYVEVGTPMIYAAVQHYGAIKGAFGQASDGGSTPWGNIPARPFMGISDNGESAIVETVSEWLRDAFE